MIRDKGYINCSNDPLISVWFTSSSFDNFASNGGGHSGD